jgi:hypothetical protein
MSSIQQKIFYPVFKWLNLIPFSYVLEALFKIKPDPDVITYAFNNEINSFVSNAKIEKSNHDGFFGVSIGQNTLS